MFLGEGYFRMNKTNIEWTDYSLNPIRGLCPKDCTLPNGQSYCYMRPIYKRFKRPQCVMFYPAVLQEIYIRQQPMRCFMCSGFEIFHPIVKSEWRDEIFRVISDNPRHTFQILTKMPENIDRPMPDNVWLGVSVTTGMDWWRWSYLIRAKAKIKFVSHEPILQETVYFPNDCDWLIVGRLTNYGKKRDPKVGYLQELVGKSIVNRTPIFMKNNLKGIWGPNLIQEFPR